MDTKSASGIFQRTSLSIKSSPLARFLAFVRPHMKLALGACVMGVLKFNFLLAFPLAFKYIIDVLLVKQNKIAAIDGASGSLPLWASESTRSTSSRYSSAP